MAREKRLPLKRFESKKGLESTREQENFSTFYCQNHTGKNTDVTENHNTSPQIFQAIIKVPRQNISSNEIIKLPVNPDHECECHQPRVRSNQILC